MESFFSLIKLSDGDRDLSLGQRSRRLTICALADDSLVSLPDSDTILELDSDECDDVTIT